MAQTYIAPTQSAAAGRGKQLCLLSLDGGGVRGLSSLFILKQLMESIDPLNPPKPCDYFDMIGGTSTGGIIAIMLGRLRMAIDECIDEYRSLSDRVFTHCKHRMTWRGNLQGRFDHDALVQATKDLLRRKNMDEDALLKDPLGDTGCATSVLNEVLCSVLRLTQLDLSVQRATRRTTCNY
jgi:patatin-like phospholipase/acyl hydrolase